MHKAGYALACNGHGIGNKLKCIASAIWNANYNQSQVAVRWVNYNKRDDATADQIFCPRFLEKLHPDLGKHEITYSTWRLLVPERLRSIVPPSTVNFWSHKGAFIDFEYCRIPQIIRGEVVSVFQEIKLNPIIYDAVEAFIKKNETLKIGVHARLWENEANDRGVDKEELIQSLHRISRRLAGEHRTKILVCTDHKESGGWIYDAAQQCFPESQVIRPEFSGWDLNNQQQALAEIVLLSRLPKLIASRSSTFSEVAWWIGGARLDMLVGLIGRHKSNIRATEVEEEEEARNGIINIDTPDILKDTTLTISFKELGFSIVSRAGVMRHLDTPNLIAQAAIQYALHYRRLMNSGRTDEIMLDVGANIGLCSLPVASMGRTVYAFEALPENLELLKRSAISNGLVDSERLQIISGAVSDINGSEIYLWHPSERSDNCSINRIAANHNVRSRDVKRIKVRSITLDQWWLDSGINPERIRLLKVDVQGAELSVLQGATRLISATKPFAKLVIEFELEPDLLRHLNTSSSELLEFIHLGLNMNIRVSPSLDSTPVIPDSFKEFNYSQPCNLYATWN